MGAPTARASNPSWTSAAISLIATVTTSGIVTGLGDTSVVLVDAFFFW
jgi:hypothetical protein